MYMADKSNNDNWVFLSHSNKGYEKLLNSESGTFYIDNHSIVQRFEPTAVNPFIEEKTVIEANFTFKTDKSIRTFIVPKGVKGFCSGFMRYTRVLERFELPDGLLNIGSNSFDYATECNCVFANCILPSVVIPESVTEIGLFTFGHSHIGNLQLSKTLHSPYGRQFKDSHIGTLTLPKEWKEYVALGEYNDLRLKGIWFDNDKYGYLRWPSAYVENLEFY